MSEDRGQEPLSYLSPQDDAEARQSELNRGWAGGVLTALSVWFATYFFVISNIPHPGLSSTRPMHQTDWAPGLVVLGVEGLILFAVARYYWVRQSRSFARGALIGLGVALLCEGICFGAQLIR